MTENKQIELPYYETYIPCSTGEFVRVLLWNCIDGHQLPSKERVDPRPIKGKMAAVMSIASKEESSNLLMMIAAVYRISNGIAVLAADTETFEYCKEVLTAVEWHTLGFDHRARQRKQ